MSLLKKSVVITPSFKQYLLTLTLQDFFSGTANANVSVYQVAADMLGVISQYRPQHVQEVHVVIYENSMLKSFIDATGKCRDQIKAEPAQYGDKVVADMGLGKIYEIFNKY